MPSAVPRSASPLPAPTWPARAVVVSPHLDDAVLSLGASLHAAARSGSRVDALTVLAGDPDSTTPADEHNRRAGFATAGEAARARREDDRRACEAVGATPVWLTLSDDRNDGSPSDDEIRMQLTNALPGYGAVLLPGYPLWHPDHLRVSRLALEILEPGTVLGFYVEQPYASWKALARRSSAKGADSPATALSWLGLQLDGQARWQSRAPRVSDWIAKWRGMSAYQSQLKVLRRWPRARILGHEALQRGEAIAWMR